MESKQFARGEFDLHRFYDRIDQVRSDRELTWARLSKAVGVSASTIRRFGSAADAEADGVLTLLGWLGVAPEEFVVESEVEGVPLPPLSGGCIRVDMAILAELPAFPARRRLGTRTTIQRLVSATQASEIPVAAAARWSSA